MGPCILYTVVTRILSTVLQVTCDIVLFGGAAQVVTNSLDFGMLL